MRTPGGCCRTGAPQRLPEKERAYGNSASAGAQHHDAGPAYAIGAASARHRTCAFDRPRNYALRNCPGEHSG